MLLQSFMLRDEINSKLWYFCQGYLRKFGYLLVVSILCKITLILLDIGICPKRYLPHFNYKKVFELVLTGNNTKNTKNTGIQGKYRKDIMFVKKIDGSKKFQR